MLEPHLKDDDLLQDIASAPAGEDCFHLWWLGQSGFLLKWGQRFLLMDPYLSDSLSTKYAGTGKPHIRMTALAIDPARLDFIDVVTSSHNHTDHLAAESLQPLMKASQEAELLIPESNTEFVIERLGQGAEEGLGKAGINELHQGQYLSNDAPWTKGPLARDATHLTGPRCGPLPGYRPTSLRHVAVESIACAAKVPRRWP